MLGQQRGAKHRTNAVPTRHGAEGIVQARQPPIGEDAHVVPLIRSWLDCPDTRCRLTRHVVNCIAGGGKPIHEWLEVRPFLTASPKFTE